MLSARSIKTIPCVQTKHDVQSPSVHQIRNRCHSWGRAWNRTHTHTHVYRMHTSVFHVVVEKQSCLYDLWRTHFHCIHDFWNILDWQAWSSSWLQCSIMSRNYHLQSCVCLKKKKKVCFCVHTTCPGGRCCGRPGFAKDELNKPDKIRAQK